MRMAKQNRAVFLLVILALVAIAPAQTTQLPVHLKKAKVEKALVGSSPAVLWREPVDIKSRNLFYGSGGKDHEPSGSMTYLGEDQNGVNAKFYVRDGNGIRWNVKLGNEAKPETAASRLVWAVGYFTNEYYFVSEMAVTKLPRLSRGEELIVDGRIGGVRMKRHNKHEDIIGHWDWDKNPFVGTKELDGLKVMMELICNTDVKREHRLIVDAKGVEQRYMLKDLGASFGKAGRTIFRTKGDLKDFQSLPLIKNAGPEFLDFWYFKHIPREHAKWIGGYLTQLSDEQISDAFRAAGFTSEEVQGFTQKVREKINELVAL